MAKNNPAGYMDLEDEVKLQEGYEDAVKKRLREVSAREWKEIALFCMGSIAQLAEGYDDYRIVGSYLKTGGGDIT